jgi:hypothetical protein
MSASPQCPYCPLEVAVCVQLLDAIEGDRGDLPRVVQQKDHRPVELGRLDVLTAVAHLTPPSVLAPTFPVGARFYNRGLTASGLIASGSG